MLTEQETKVQMDKMVSKWQNCNSISNSLKYGSKRASVQPTNWFPDWKFGIIWCVFKSLHSSCRKL